MGGATTPRRSRAGVRVVVASALAACLALLVTACGGSDVTSPPSLNTLPTTSPSTSAPTVTVTGLPAGVQVEIGRGAPGVSPGSGLDFVSPVYELGPSGPLDARATVTMELDHAVPAGTRLVTATRESSSEDWSWMPAKLTADLHHATFTTTHFSQFGVLTLDASAAVSTFKQFVHDGLESGHATSVKQPVCHDEKGARLGGWKAASSRHQSLYWCLDLVEGAHVLKVANRREVPVQVTDGQARPLTTDSKVSGAWTTWLGLLGSDGDTTFLAPGGSVSYDAEIVPGADLVLSTQSNPKALATRALYAAVGGLVSQLSSYGASVPTTEQAFAELVARPQCADALGQTSEVFREACLTRRPLTRVLGDGTRLLAPVITAPGMEAFWAKQLAFLAEQDKDVDSQRISVSRRSADFGSLVGTYTGAARSLSISSTGVVTERLDGGSDRVIALTYQLSGPTTKDGTATASAALTRVKVYDRSAITGQVPKVGDIGTLTLHDGIITPPYLQTTYCDSTAAAAGSCSS